MYEVQYFLQRFQCTLGIFVFLAVNESEAATEAFCNIEMGDWSFNDEKLVLKVCEVDIEKVDDDDFTITTDLDESIQGFNIKNETGVKFLPTYLSCAFPDLITFQVHNCSVTSVKENHFNGLSKLRSLSLNYNKIETIYSDAFVDLTSLELLALAHNRIQSFEKTTFASLRRLQSLYLSYNQIETLHPDIFDSLKNVEVINLSNNRLSSIDEDVFKNTTRIRWILLLQNELVTIPSNLFTNNLKLERVWLHDNKIKVLDAKMFGHLPLLEVFDSNGSMQPKFCIYGSTYGMDYDELSSSLEAKCHKNDS